MADYNNRRDDDYNLEPLEDLDGYKVHHDDPDVRGWEVIDSSGRVIGEVEELLCNKALKKVRYLDVEVRNDVIGDDHVAYSSSAEDGIHEYVDSDGENHLIIPIGVARLDTEDHRVTADRLTPEMFSKTKTYRKGREITPDYEEHVVAVYVDDDERVSRSNAEEFYNQRCFNEGRFYSEDRDTRERDRDDDNY